MIVTLGQQYNVGDKPTVIMYPYINRHAGTPEKQQKQKTGVLIIYHNNNNSAVELYISRARGLGQQ